MIAYFSGTGNSRAVAEELARHTGDVVVSITEVPPSEIEYSGNWLTFVVPVHYWGIPPIVIGYIKNLNDRFVRDAYCWPVNVVLVCGDDVGKAPEMLHAALHRRDYNLFLHGAWDVHMPNTYVLLPGFDVDSKKVERRKLAAYKDRVKYIASRMVEFEDDRDFKRGLFPEFKTMRIYPFFLKHGVVSSRWKATDACVHCGICEKTCPVGNISLAAGRPEWGDDCVGCLACYHSCPKHAVHYGSVTRRKGQYLFRPGKRSDEESEERNKG